MVSDRSEHPAGAAAPRTPRPARPPWPRWFGELRFRSRQDDERTRALRSQLRLYTKDGIPTARAIDDPTILNVAPSVQPPPTGDYVRRDQDEELDRLLDYEVFVLIIGEPASGKTRTAAEAAQRRFPGRRLIWPDHDESVNALLDLGLDLTDCVIWLDDLGGYLRRSALSRLLDHLTGPNAPAGAIVLATMSAREFEAHLPYGGYQSPYWPVLKRAGRLRLARLFSAAELVRVTDSSPDPELVAALDRFGLAEYLAAGPELLERWEHALLESGSAPGADDLGARIGALVVLAAVHWSRAGLSRPIPANVLFALVGRYVAAAGWPALDRAELDRGLAWAREPVRGAGSLLAEVTGGYVASDYVADRADSWPVAQVPDAVWNAALGTVHDDEEALHIGFAAHRLNRADFAVRAFEVALRESSPEKQIMARLNLALALERAHRFQEAQEHYLRAADDGRPDAAHAAGRLFEARGNIAEAERLYRVAADAGNVEGSYALGLLLRATDPEEAVHHLITAADRGHPDAAYPAGQLLTTRGELREAERLYRIAADAGNTDSSYALGLLLRVSNPDEALRRLATAADRGHLDAAHTAGTLLKDAGDDDTAARFFRIAADAGNIESSYELGLLLYPSNSDEALYYLSTAADHGHAEAARTAGTLLRDAGNSTAAARFFRIAADSSGPGGLQHRAATAPPGRPPTTKDVLGSCAALLAGTKNLEQTMAEFSNAQLRWQTGIFQRRLASGEELDVLAPEAFGTLREVARRVAGLECGDEEVLAAAAAHYGLVAQLRPRHGRLLAVALPAYLNALAGRPVHVLSVDESAARLDADRLGPVLRFLGLDTGLLASGMPEESRRLAYRSEVLFGTLAEFCFDYLRDHNARSAAERVQEPLGLAIAAHADLQLLEEIDEQFVLPAPDQESSPWFARFAALAGQMTRGQHYEMVPDADRADVTAPGITFAEEALGVGRLHAVENIPLINHLDLALRAKELYRPGEDYAVQDGRIVLLNQNTGQAKPDATYPDGLHQAIEAKEGLAVSPRPIARLRTGKRGYLSRYAVLGGLATAVGSSEETLELAYGLATVRIPPQDRVPRVDHDDWLFPTDEARWSALAALVRERNAAGQPVLVEVGDPGQAEQFGAALDRLGVRHTDLTTRSREYQAQILGAAGRPGAVTVAVHAHLSLADCPLGGAGASPADLAAATNAGGLLVLGAQRYPERWRDDRLRELAGRDGRRGESRFLLAGTDPVCQGAWLPTAVVPGPLSGLMLTWGIEARQRLLGATRLDALRRQLAFEQVEEAQRREFFALRERVLAGTDINSLTHGYLRDTLERYAVAHLPGAGRGRPDPAGSASSVASLDAALTRLLGVGFARTDRVRDEVDQTEAAQEDRSPQPADSHTAADSRGTSDARPTLAEILTLGEGAWEARRRLFAPAAWLELQRTVLLSVLSRNWPDHLAALDELRESAPLAAFRNADPLIEYERAANVLYEQMHAAVKEEAVGYVMNLQVEPSEP